MPPQQPPTTPATPPQQPAPQTPPPAPATPTPPPPPAPPERSFLASFGPTLGLVILAIAVILGGLYIWGSRIAPEDLAADPMEGEEQTAAHDPTPTTSQSDELDAIESDFESNSELDAEMAAVEAELDAMEAEMSAQ